MRRRVTRRLQGSYRLPIRISECIAPISRALVTKGQEKEGVNAIESYKHAPPGARPIVVYAESTYTLMKKIHRIFNVYKCYGLDKITILERDKKLAESIEQAGITTETDSILALKGLEKKCVLWSTRIIPIEYEDNALEFVYTILSRTSCILIIALSPQTIPAYKEIIGLLNQERAIFWDKDTESRFPDFCSEMESTVETDE